MLLSPYLAPSSLSLAPFALGNRQSCEFAGYLVVTGMAAVPTYTLFLTYYFMRRIKYKVSPQKFSGLEEKIWHISGVLTPLGFATTALSMGYINSSDRSGTMCFLASEPYDCKETGSECIRGEKAEIFAAAFGATGATLFICLMVVLYMFTHHVYSIEKDFTIPASSTQTRKQESKPHLNFMKNKQEPTQNTDSKSSGKKSPNGSKNTSTLSSVELNSTPSSGQEEAQESSDGLQDVNLSQNQNSPQEESVKPKMPSQSNQRELSKKALNQSLLYIFAFLFMYMPGMVQIILRGLKYNVEDSRIMLWWSSIIYPIGGVLNVLIYTRPKCQKFRKDIPGLPYLTAFIVIVLNGGEVPSLTDLGIAARLPDSYTGKEEGNFDEHYQKNYLEYEERQAEREILNAQMRVKLDELSAFMKSALGIDSAMEKNLLESENMNQYDGYSLDWDSSIGPGQLKNSNIDSHFLSEGEIGTSEWDD